MKKQPKKTDRLQINNLDRPDLCVRGFNIKLKSLLYHLCENYFWEK